MKYEIIYNNHIIFKIQPPSSRPCHGWTDGTSASPSRSACFGIYFHLVTFTWLMFAVSKLRHIKINKYLYLLHKTRVSYFIIFRNSQCLHMKSKNIYDTQFRTHSFRIIGIFAVLTWTCTRIWSQLTMSHFARLG